MRPKLFALAAIACLATRPSLSADVQVRVQGELVDVQTVAAPVCDILARLSEHTGMKVIYEGPPPRSPVTATLVQRTPVEVVLTLFEGLGLNYAMRADASGRRVETLIVAGNAGTRPSSTAVASPVPPQPPVPLANDDPNDPDAALAPPAPAPQPSPAESAPTPPKAAAPLYVQPSPLTWPAPPPPPPPPKTPDRPEASPTPPAR